MRARNIKPGFFDNVALGTMDPLAQLLFAGLWCLADRSGRIKDCPPRIKKDIFPYRDADVDALLWMLAAGPRPFIVRYQYVDPDNPDAIPDRFIEIVNFQKHQNPHKNEAKSTIPPAWALGTSEVTHSIGTPSIYGTSSVQVPYSHGVSRGTPDLATSQPQNGDPQKAAQTAENTSTRSIDGTTRADSLILRFSDSLKSNTCASGDAPQLDNEPFQPLFDEDDPELPPINHEPEKPKSRLEQQQDLWFEEFWEGFWKKRGRKNALKMFRRYAKTPDDFRQIMDAMKRDAPTMLARADEHRKMAEGWLNSEVWREKPAKVEAGWTQNGFPNVLKNPLHRM